MTATPPNQPGQYGTPQDQPYAAPPVSAYDSPPTYPPPPMYAPQPGYPGGYAASPVYGPSGPEIFAHWGRRVGASLLDSLFALPGFALIVISAFLLVPGAGPTTGRQLSVNPAFPILALLGYAIAIGLQAYNRWYRMGRTGQSWGKKVVGIRLVSEQTGQPVGMGLAFARDLAHVVDGFFYLGYLWPLWDAKRQTFADKICSTVVLAH